MEFVCPFSGINMTNESDFQLWCASNPIVSICIHHLIPFSSSRPHVLCSSTPSGKDVYWLSNVPAQCPRARAFMVLSSFVARMGEAEIFYVGKLFVENQERKKRTVFHVGGKFME